MYSLLLAHIHYQEAVRLLNQALEADAGFAKAWILSGQVQSERYALLLRDPNRQKEAQLAQKAVTDALEKGT